MSDEVSADGVHIAHCCARHGCKYGQGLTGQCPVVGQRAEQAYPCEYGTRADPCMGPIIVPDSVRRVAVRAFWDAVGPDELTAGGADEALQRAVEAVIDAWEQWREE